MFTGLNLISNLWAFMDFLGLVPKTEISKNTESFVEIITRRKPLSQNKIQKLIELIHKGIDSTRDINGYTPMTWAIRHGHEDVIQALVDARGSTDATGAGQTALGSAVSCEYNIDYRIRVINMLLAIATDLNARDKWRGRTALHWAVGEHRCVGALDLIQTLLARGAAIDSRDNQGFTPLHKAVLINGIQMLEKLLASGARIDIKDNVDETPLLMAARLEIQDPHERFYFFKTFLIRLINSIKHDNEFLLDFNESFPNFSERCSDDDFNRIYGFNGRYGIEDQIVAWTVTRPPKLKNEIAEWIQDRYSVYQAPRMSREFFENQRSNSPLTNMLLKAITPGYHTRISVRRYSPSSSSVESSVAASSCSSSVEWRPGN